MMTISHTEITLDEMTGLQKLNYICDKFEYGANKKYTSIFHRSYILLLNAFKLLIKAYKFKPDYIYINSRLEFIGSARDFATILFIKIFYFTKIHFVIKSHGSDLEVLQTKKFFFRKIVFPFLKRYVSAWLFLSNEELEWIVSNNLIEERKLFRTKNIVRIEKFKIDQNFRNKFSIPEDYKILLFVGRIIKQKGIHDVIDAYARIKVKNKVILIIVGDGEELDAIKEKIENLNIKNDVIVIGWVDEEQATYFTSNSDILIFPTYFPEGFPMALFNSVGAGLSIVTTPLRAALDYLKEPRNCLWVQPESSNSIESAVNRLLNDSNLMNEMRQNNKEDALLFTKDPVSKELSSILNSILIGKDEKNLRKHQKLSNAL
jgi:glycosyltransferase involved in cell wall biosynthesis